MELGRYREGIRPDGRISQAVRGTRGSAGHEGRIVAPVLLLRASGKDGLEYAQDRTVFAVVHADEDGTPCMLFPCLRPLSSDAREIVDVEGDHDAIFSRGEREQVGVAPAVQCAFFVCGPHVMPSLTEYTGDAARRQMGVEEEPHLRGEDVDGWEGAAEFGQ